MRSLGNRERRNAELREELQFHVERAVEEKMASGMPEAEARAAAQAEFGSLTQTTEECYESRGLTWVADFFQDVRYGFRTLIKHRSFTVVTVLTLALGIGACTAIFSLVNAVLLRSLPYGDPERLVYLYTPTPQYDLPPEVFAPTNADFFDLRRLGRSYSDMTMFQEVSYNLAMGTATERVGAARVDTEFFRTLHVAPAFGRVFDATDMQAGESRVAVIGYGLWQSLFDGRNDVLGKTVQLDGVNYRVVGVMPPEFAYPHKSEVAFGNSGVEKTELWSPLIMTAREKADREEGNGWTLARLRPGVTVKEAEAELGILMLRLDLLHAVEARGHRALVKPFLDEALGPVRPLMWLMSDAVGFVLLIACGNAANLLLARAADRSHELGVRATLGAGRGRLLRQMLTEALMLSVLAGCTGAGLAWIILHALLRLNPGDIPRMAEATLDYHVLGFLAGVTVLTSVLFGVLPALLSARMNLSEVLSRSGLRGVVGDRGLVRKALAIAQVAMVVVLLTGAGLLLRSYAKVLAVPTGFSPTTVAVSLQLSPPSFVTGAQNPRYSTTAQRAAFFAQVLARLQAMAGIQSAGVVDMLPLSGAESLTTFEAKGFLNKENQLVEERRVTPGYFSAMQIPVVKGRGFTQSDGPGHPSAIVVNEALAKEYFGTVNAVGHQIRQGTEGPWETVVGVVGDVRNMRPEENAAPQVYRSFFQGPPDANSASITVRSALPENAVVGLIRAVVRSIDPSLAIGDVRTMSDLESEVTARRAVSNGRCLAAFSGVAMLLAIIGVYGLLAYSVRQRTGEIGIRVALGSTRSGVVGLVLREGLTLLGFGLAIGLIAAAGATRVLSAISLWCFGDGWSHLCVCVTIIVTWHADWPALFPECGRRASIPWMLCVMSE